MKLKNILLWGIFSLAILFLLFSKIFSFHISTIFKLIIILIISAFIVIKSANFLIEAISDYGKKTGFSEYLIGLFVLAIGTTLPDLSTGVIASLTNNGNLILGDVIGANILDMTIVLGCIIFFSKKLKIKDKSIKKTTIWIPFAVTLPLMLAVDGTFSRLDGFLLILSFIAYLFYSFEESPDIKLIKKNVKFKNIWKDMIIFLLALAALLLGTRWLVFSAVYLSKIFSIPLYIVGLLLIAIGTTMPELLVAIESSLKKESGLAIGDILGAMAINSSLVIGISCLISPIMIENKTNFLQTGMFMVFTTLIGMFLLRRKEVRREIAFILLLLYIIFVVIQIL